MTLRSRLFATVALPVLSVTMIAEPALAAGNRAGQQAEWLMAQALEGDLDGDGQLSAEEQQLLDEQRQQQEQPAEEPAAPAEEPAAPAEEPAAPAEEPAAPAEEPAAPAEEPAAPAEEPAAPAEEPAAPAEEPAAPAEEPAAPAEEPAAPAEEPAAPAEEPAAPAEEPAAPAEEPAAPAEEPAAPAEEPAAPAEEPAAPAEEPAAPAEEPAAPAEEPAAPAEEPAAPAEEPAAPAEEPAAPAEEPAAPAEEPAAPAEEPAAPAEEPAAPAEEPAAPAEEPAAPAEEPAAPAEQPEASTTDAPLPVIEDNLTEEQKQQIAEDPSKTADTVVLPVDNGGAVLDSDKDADTTGGAQSRDERTKAREQVDVAPAPETDADAQAALPVLEPALVNEALQEKGQKISEAPQFAVPGVGGDVNNVTNNTTNNTVINNTVTNNTVVNNVTQVNVVEKVDNSVVLNVGNQIVVRSDDRERLRMDSNDSFYENLSRGRSRETIIREDGTRIVTVYNRYGDIIQRSRIRPDGDEYVMLYAPEADTEEPRRIYDAGWDLPPMRLTVPVDDYIVSTSRAEDEDYYTFLEKPPVEKVERVYTIDEVRYSARLRDKVRRIDLDTITFASGSAEVPMSQAKTLKKVASAIVKVLKKDPGETFLIEGHTDAVGSDKSNLVLSDNRASSVAALLTEVYGIPPENLVTQGYGERYLKIRTTAAEQQNRRVTIRRVTPLVRPVAKK